MDKRIIGIILICISFVLCVLGIIFLPETVTVQINSRGEISNSMAKLFAVAIPFLLTVFCSVWYIIGNENEGKKLIAAVVGVIMAVLVLVFNIFR